MHVLDPPSGELDNLDRVCARDHEMSDVEANARLRADQQALDLLRPLDRAAEPRLDRELEPMPGAKDRKSTRLNSSHGYISYAVFCLKKKKSNTSIRLRRT